MKPSRIALSPPAARHFLPGMVASVDGVEVRVVDVEPEAILVDRPLWWRTWRWLTRWRRR